LLTRRADIASEADAAALLDWIADTLGGLDVLINNAGLFRGYELSSSAAPQMSAEDIEINVLGTMRMTRLALPLLAKSPEGAIVFVSSAVALGAVPGFAVYGATKAAVHSFARSLRAELAGSGIGVFDVLPPIVDTGAAQALDVPKLSPGAVADAIVQGVERDRTEIRIGRIRLLAVIARIAPTLADRLLAKALTQP
jgi:uncharacterized oxidoreductase